MKILSSINWSISFYVAATIQAFQHSYVSALIFAAIAYIIEKLTSK